MNRRTFGKLAGLAGTGALIERGMLAETDASSSETTRSVWDSYFLGAAYYPEWWAPSEWETDFRQMRELGINTIRIGRVRVGLF